MHRVILGEPFRKEQVFYNNKCNENIEGPPLGSIMLKLKKRSLVFFPTTIIQQLGVSVISFQIKHRRDFLLDYETI